MKTQTNITEQKTKQKTKQPKHYNTWTCSVQALLDQGGKPHTIPGFFILKSESGNRYLIFKEAENRPGIVKCLGANK